MKHGEVFVFIFHKSSFLFCWTTQSVPAWARFMSGQLQLNGAIPGARRRIRDNGEYPTRTHRAGAAEAKDIPRQAHQRPQMQNDAYA
jgi:hypothetical protein